MNYNRSWLCVVQLLTSEKRSSILPQKEHYIRFQNPRWPLTAFQKHYCMTFKKHFAIVVVKKTSNSLNHVWTTVYFQSLSNHPFNMNTSTTGLVIKYLCSSCLYFSQLGVKSNEDDKKIAKVTRTRTERPKLMRFVCARLCTFRSAEDCWF